MNRFEITVGTPDGPVSYSGLFTGSVDAVCYAMDTFPEARAVSVIALRNPVRGAA